MMDHTHTPGPWALDELDMSIFAEVGASICDVTDIDDFPCLEEGTENDVHAECVANARLIAAAPELLAALKALPAILEEVRLKWDEGMRSGKLLIALLDPSMSYRPDVSAIHAALAKAEGRS